MPGILPHWHGFTPVSWLSFFDTPRRALTQVTTTRVATVFPVVNEEWRPVRDWEGLYEVSSHGLVRSVERYVKGREGSSRKLQGRQLTPRVRPDGVVAVNLWRGNRYRQLPVRRLVLEAFDRAKPQGFDAVNRNGDPADNKLANLEWRPDRRLRGIENFRQKITETT